MECRCTPRRSPELIAPLVGAALATLVATTILAGAAFAAVRYVSPSGSSSNSGATALSPWSLSKANSSLVAGDVCYVLPGIYSSPINPSSSGGANQRITYVGDISNPSRARVSSISISKDWITVKGVEADGGAGIEYPGRRDSIAYCIMNGLGIGGAKYSMVAANEITGTISIAANDGRACYSGTAFDPECIANSEYDTLRANHIDLGTMGPGSRRFDVRGLTKACLFEANRIEGVFDNGSSTNPDASVALICYNTHELTFRDNHWEMETLSRHNSTNQMWAAFALRDSTTDCLFERDTMLLALNSADQIRGQFAASGNWPGSTRRNRWNQCYYKINGYFYNQDKFLDNTIENSVFASKTGNALWFAGVYQDSKLRHNLFYSVDQSVRFDDNIDGTDNDISSNIFYSQDPNPTGNGGGQIQFGRDAQHNFTSNYNLFFSPVYTNSPGDRSIVWCCYGGGRPGAGQGWNNVSGQDGASKYGPVLLVDSTLAGLDPHLLPGSAAFGMGEGGTDAGPLGLAPPQVDDTSPNAVTSLNSNLLLDHTIMLTWNAPGDDGNSGRAAAYDLRWSTSPINDSNFSSASSLTAPVPLVAGTAQSQIVLNLTANTRYYFALKARDEANNWSGLSNVYSPTTQAHDTTPPSTISDLATQ